MPSAYSVNRRKVPNVCLSSPKYVRETLRIGRGDESQRSRLAQGGMDDLPPIGTGRSKSRTRGRDSLTSLFDGERDEDSSFERRKYGNHVKFRPHTTPTSSPIRQKKDGNKPLLRCPSFSYFLFLGPHNLRNTIASQLYHSL